jgi:hypothetical protein
VFSIVRSLKERYHKEQPGRIGFRSFCRRSEYRSLVRWCGYSDFGRADARDTLELYRFSDCTDELRSSSIDWDLLIEKMAEKLRATRRVRIQMRSEVSCVRKHGDGFRCEIDGRWINARRVVIATTVRDYRIFSGLSGLASNIGYQPFLRLYGRLAEPFQVPGMVYADSPYRKIYSVSKDPRFICLSYSDNEDAETIRKKTATEIRYDLADVFRRRFPVIQKLWHCYHPVGTHYFRPLLSSFPDRVSFVEKIQNPCPGLFVVGEAVAFDQGWTEGALESVDRIVGKIRNT